MKYLNLNVLVCGGIAYLISIFSAYIVGFASDKSPDIWIAAFMINQICNCLMAIIITMAAREPTL
jgi:hypothetical protein